MFKRLMSLAAVAGLGASLVLAGGTPAGAEPPKPLKGAVKVSPMKGSKGPIISSKKPGPGPVRHGGGNRDGGNSYRVEGSSRFPSPREQLERDIEDHKRTARQLRQGCCFTGEHPALYHDRMVRALEMQLLMMDGPEAVTAWMRAMGSKGGQKGGPARAKKLSSKRRSEIAAKAANARWAKP